MREKPKKVRDSVQGRNYTVVHVPEEPRSIAMISPCTVRREGRLHPPSPMSWPYGPVPSRLSPWLEDTRFSTISDMKQSTPHSRDSPSISHRSLLRNDAISCCTDTNLTTTFLFGFFVNQFSSQIILDCEPIEGRFFTLNISFVIISSCASRWSFTHKTVLRARGRLCNFSFCFLLFLLRESGEEVSYLRFNLALGCEHRVLVGPTGLTGRVRSEPWPKRGFSPIAAAASNGIRWRSLVTDDSFRSLGRRALGDGLRSGSGEAPGPEKDTVEEKASVCEAKGSAWSGEDEGRLAYTRYKDDKRTSSVGANRRG